MFVKALKVGHHDSSTGTTNSLDLVVFHVGADAHTVAVDVSSANPLADSYTVPVGKPPAGLVELPADAGDTSPNSDCSLRTSTTSSSSATL